MSLTNVEKEKLQNVVDGMSPEEKQYIASLLDSGLLFDELRARDKRNREVINKVAESIAR